jgi:hypothetical protein
MENSANHADIEKLVANTEAVTRAAKIIEARISIDIWTRQQRWDVQKAALLDSLKELASSEVCLRSLVTTLSSTKNHPLDERTDLRREAHQNLGSALSAFSRTRLAVQIVCGNQIGEQFDTIDRLFTIARNRAVQGEFGDVWTTQFNEILAAKKELGDLIRKQLDLEPMALTLDPVNFWAAQGRG